jgi:hypothetical protein
MRDQEAIDFDLQLVAALRQFARERGDPLPSIDMADALLDERRALTESSRENTTQRTGRIKEHGPSGHHARRR